MIKIIKENTFTLSFFAFLFVGIFFIVIWCGGVWAQTPASTASAEIQDFKKKLATKVDELRRKDEKAIAGTLTSIEKSKLKIRTPDEVLYEIKIDDVLTKLYEIAGTGKSEIAVDDLEKNAYLIVTGPINDKTVSANYIYVDEQFVTNTGKITEVNGTDFTLTVFTQERETVTLDVENNTKRQIINIKTLALEVVGFTKIKEGDTIHYIAEKAENKEARFSAIKVLIIPQEYFQK